MGRFQGSDVTTAPRARTPDVTFSKFLNLVNLQRPIVHICELLLQSIKVIQFNSAFPRTF